MVLRLGLELELGLRVSSSPLARMVVVRVVVWKPRELRVLGRSSILLARLGLLVLVLVVEAELLVLSLTNRVALDLCHCPWGSIRPSLRLCFGSKS